MKTDEEIADIKEEKRNINNYKRKQKLIYKK